MAKRLRGLVPGLGLIAMLCLVSVPNAEAALMLAATAGGVNICAADQDVACGFGTQVPDTDPAPNSLGVGGITGIVIGGLDVRGSLHTATFGPPQNILRSSSLSVTNTTGAPVSAMVAVGATDFVGPSLTATTSGSGTWVSAIGATIQLDWCNDPANAQHGTTPADCGPVIDTFSHTATADPDSFSHDGGPFVVNDPNLFAMGLRFAFTLPGGGQLLSRGQAEIKPTAIPEPATLILLGVGIGAFARRLRRKQRAA
jgi:hypothetical protein